MSNIESEMNNNKKQYKTNNPIDLLAVRREKETKEAKKHQPEQQCFLPKLFGAINLQQNWTFKSTFFLQIFHSLFCLFFSSVVLSRSFMKEQHHVHTLSSIPFTFSCSHSIDRERESVCERERNGESNQIRF